MSAELSEQELESIKETIDRRNIIMQNILDVKKMELAFLIEKEREAGIVAAKKKAKAITKRRASKAARKVNRRK